MASSFLSRMTSRLAGRRSELSPWLTGIGEHALERPGSVAGRLLYKALGADAGEADPNPELTASTRVYFGPLNYAGQAHLWARALRADLPDVAAVNAAVVAPRSALNFPSDISIPLRVYRGSDAWRAEQRLYLRRFTHVVAESGRSLLGERVASDPFDEFSELRSEGVRTAIMLHGTDARLPSRHRATHAHSPFQDAERFAGTERRVSRLLSDLESFDGPVFVSTPDLLADVPWAAWCPVAVDPALWATDSRPLTRPTPLVVHVPSRSSVKGTELIEPAIRALEADGLIAYRRIEGVPPSSLPAMIADADIVLDQFALGSYGVAACEAMAAGRVVIGDVDDGVREAVSRAGAGDLPIVQARAGEIARVLRGVLADRDAYAAHAQHGVDFVAALHSGPGSAARLADGLDIRR
ncbi:hypothetical protein AB4Z18_16605 [Leifsonia sp. 2TAF2]|uniref:hypothetical protein n=1 Tax=Leifsonia sp. 2TAF2 TaxID=3233009 RepID=UPI003F9A5E65